MSKIFPNERITDKLKRLEAENKKLRECLAWYAEESNWQTWCDFGTNKNCKDKLIGSELNEKGYQRAQDCLKELGTK